MSALEVVQRFAFEMGVGALIITGLLVAVLGALHLWLKMVDVILRKWALTEAVVAFAYRYHAEKRARKGE